MRTFRIFASSIFVFMMALLFAAMVIDVKL